MSSNVKISEITRERWIKQMMDDYPQIDRLMADMVISQWCDDPDYFDKVKRGEIVIPPPIERNTNYVLKSVTIDD